MEILVCVKLVSESLYTDSLQDASKDRLATGRLVMNPVDEYALELALRLRAARPGSRLTLLTLAPQSAEHMLRTGLAMGADEAVHVCDPCFAGSDTLATAAVLAAGIRAISFRGLIICGQKSIDSETGHIGPQLSVFLQLPALTNVLSFQADADGIVAEQLRDGGTVTVHSPDEAVLTVCRGTQMVRRPTITGLRTAAGKPYRLLKGPDLDIPPESTGAAGSPTRVVRVEQILHRKRSGSVLHDAEAGTAFLLQLIRGTEVV